MVATADFRLRTHGHSGRLRRASRRSPAADGFRRVRVRRPRSAARVAVAGVLLVAACSNEGRRAVTCDEEHLDVTWPATIERGGAVAREELRATLTPTNVAADTFRTLAGVLVQGRADAPAVAWTVPAFDTDPGGIAVRHKASLSRGEIMRIAGALDIGEWGVSDSVPSGGAQVGVEAGAFVAREATGTIAVLETAPVALRLDLTARDSAGETIRVRGDARFGHHKERRRCDEVATGPGG